jgi:hypothetical protein
LFFSQLGNAQIHYPDEHWPLGYNEFPGLASSGNAWMHFQSDTVLVEQANLNMAFESTVAVASDLNGNILFYSNGCEVRGADGQLLSGADGLNPGALHDWVCAYGYTVPRGMMALPLPEDSSRWLLLHTGGNYHPVKKITYGPFYYSEIDMSANGNLGAMLSKNNVLSEESVEPFAVVRHGNGRDWWLILPEHNSNRYQKWLINPQGIAHVETQVIGDTIGCRRIGSSVFSMDGSRYARTNNCKTIVFEFDRCSGQLSNAIVMERSPNTLGGGGLAFSSDNRFLYAPSHGNIFKADLDASSPFLDSLYKQPYYEGISKYISGTSLAYMQMAPNGTVYISAQHREQFLSGAIIEGDSLTYEKEALPLPVENIRTLPHFPNFRLYDWPDQICDTLGINEPIVSSVEKVIPEFRISMFPNPFQESVTLVMGDYLPSDAHMVLYDAIGRKVYQQQVFSGSNVLNPEGLVDGLYWYVVKERAEVVASGKVVKEGGN